MATSRFSKNTWNHKDYVAESLSRLEGIFSKIASGQPTGGIINIFSEIPTHIPYPTESTCNTVISRIQGSLARARQSRDGYRFSESYIVIYKRATGAGWTVIFEWSANQRPAKGTQTFLPD